MYCFDLQTLVKLLAFQALFPFSWTGAIDGAVCTSTAMISLAHSGGLTWPGIKAGWTPVVGSSPYSIYGVADGAATSEHVFELGLG